MTSPGFSVAATWSPFAADDVLPDLLAWQAAGLGTALVTLINIEGTTPRPLGAQMAVASDGRFTGYLSGGCVEHSVAIDGTRAIAARANLTVRYGKGSPYVDIKLPCGSGLDLYVDQAIPQRVLAEAAALRAQRSPFYLVTNIETGESRIEASTGIPKSALVGTEFKRAIMPTLNILLVGSGPSMAALAHTLSAAGFGLLIATTSDHTRQEVERLGLSCHSIEEMQMLPPAAIDRWTAAVLAFHEHDWEAPLLATLLTTPAFYIGALGGKAAHTARQSALRGLGQAEADIARVRGPIGMISGAKSRGILAPGVAAEIIAEAKSFGLIV